MKAKYLTLMHLQKSCPRETLLLFKTIIQRRQMEMLSGGNAVENCPELSTDMLYFSIFTVKQHLSQANAKQCVNTKKLVDDLTNVRKSYIYLSNQM